MKQRVMLTEHQTETWLAALSQFPPKVVRRAILEIGLSGDPFPDLGKVVLLCQNTISSKEYAPYRDENKVSRSTIQKAADAFGFES